VGVDSEIHRAQGILNLSDVLRQLICELIHAAGGAGEAVKL